MGLGVGSSLHRLDEVLGGQPDHGCATSPEHSDKPSGESVTGVARCNRVAPRMASGMPLR
jgi:hypothetical protein